MVLLSLRVRPMAETVYLNDGSMEVIFEDKDVFLERLLREKLGDDVARCFRECVAELLEAPRLNRNALKSVTRNAFNAIYKNL